MVLVDKLGRKGFALVLIAVLVIAGGGAYLLKHKNTETIKVTSTKSANSKDSKKKSSNSESNNASDSSSANSSDTSKSVPASTANLQKPYGTFVSNHHPNLGGSPAPSTEQSVCYAAPGATCYIEFTKGTSVKKLPAEQADSSGIVAWNWDVKQTGFSTGSWTIQAVASLNGKTMTAQDDLKLEVQP